MSRPGLALLESRLGEQLRGRPGPAARAALAAAGADPDHRADHLVDAACAQLVGGEPRAAQATLEAIDASSEPAARRVRACRAWASALDRNWYPGGTAAEIGGQAELLDRAALTAADEETHAVELAAAVASELLSLRSLLEFQVRHQSERVDAFLAQSARLLESVGTSGKESDLGWALAAYADLAWRAGEPGAEQLLAQVREAAAQAGDPVGQVGTWLIEGDWYAGPGSSPAALGYDLAPHSLPCRRASARDHTRAAACYEAAGALLGDPAAAPRATGAVALRQAMLAWAARDLTAQRSALGTARASFELAGDGAALQLVAVHRLLSDLAGDGVASVRRRSGTGWDMRARGTIAAVLAWSAERGSTSFAFGLGRLLQRAAEEWEAEVDHDRAAVTLSMALPLQAPGGPGPAARVLADLAAIDGQRNFSIRSLARLEQALRLLPPVVELGDDPTAWMDQVNLLMSIALAQSMRAGSSTAGRGIVGFEHALTRMRTLAAAGGVPLDDLTPSLLRDGDAVLARIGRSLIKHPVDKMTALSAQVMREQISWLAPLVAMQRGLLAQRAGWREEADRWFESALATADAGGPEVEWVGVLICANWRRDAEARRRLATVRDRGRVADDHLARLALRARDFPVAAEAFARVPVSDAWIDVADRAELALELGDPAGALELADIAIAKLEVTVGTLGRDPDRLHLTDSVTVVALYLLAARAALALAADAATEPERGTLLARGFGHADRAGSLTMANLVAGARQAAGDDALRRRWQQAATEWSGSFDRLLDRYESDVGQVPEALTRELSAADDALVALEAELPPATLTAARRLPDAPDWDAVRAGLPPGTCVLRYLLFGRHLLVFAMTRSHIEAQRISAEAAEVEGLVRQFWRGCADSSPAAAVAEELAAVLLAPAAATLRACSRVVVVPSGTLAAVAFHALPFDGAPFGDGRVVSIAPVASLLAGRTLGAPLSGTGTTVIGDPAFDAALHPGLPRLAAAAVEARAVGRTWRTADVLVGDAADEASVRTRIEGRAIVHLAAHGHLDEISPSNSALVLAGGDMLTVSDLVGLRLDAELAVLSACDSGRGVATLGGDVVGLTRGLISAGVRQAVVSLWPVDDVAACVTMSLFHEALTRTRVPAVALADAQTIMRSLTPAQVTARYVALGGDAAAPSLRRGARTAPPVRPLLAVDPVFADDDVVAPDGALERVWAPFVVVGV